MKQHWVAIFVTFFLMTFYIWTTDTVTLQGERTVYTVDCLNGTWVGNRCSGEISAGPRFRYRALKGHREVLFWVLGAKQPSSKLTGCTVQDGRNWTCPESADAPKSLTLVMTNGEPVHNSTRSTRPFHSDSKVNWILLDFGVKFWPEF